MTQINKADTIQQVALTAGIEKAQAEKAIAALAVVIRLGMSGADGQPKVGESVKVEGFGKFEVRETAAGTSQNPQVLTARKLIATAATEGATVDAKKLEAAVALIAKVDAGEVWETKPRDASLKIGFKPEKALKTWAGEAAESDDDDAGEPVVTTATETPQVAPDGVPDATTPPVAE